MCVHLVPSLTLENTGGLIPGKVIADVDISHDADTDKLLAAAVSVSEPVWRQRMTPAAQRSIQQVCMWLSVCADQCRPVQRFK